MTSSSLTIILLQFSCTLRTLKKFFIYATLDKFINFLALLFIIHLQVCSSTNLAISMKFLTLKRCLTSSLFLQQWHLSHPFFMILQASYFVATYAIFLWDLSNTKCSFNLIMHFIFVNKLCQCMNNLDPHYFQFFEEPS